MRFRIISPVRLHMSLLDLNGSLNRIDGGFGATLASPNCIIEFAHETSSSIEFTGPAAWKDLFTEIVQQMSRKYDIVQKNTKVTMIHEIPAHIGLGSKTQFALTVAKGLSLLNQMEIPVAELTRIVRRGGTSGIGYQAFEKGGFICDLGHSYGDRGEKAAYIPSSKANTNPALPFFRYPIPDTWRAILIHLNVPVGAYGQRESDVFQQYTPISLQDVQQISHHLLFQIFPSILTQDLATFANGLWFINTHGFKAIEISLQADSVQKLMTWLYQTYKLPVGMSSFGPIIFVVTPNETEAIKIQAEIVHQLQFKWTPPGGTVDIASFQNIGFRVENLE